MKLHKQVKSCNQGLVGKQLVKCHCKRPAGRVGDAHAKSSDRGISLAIELRVVNGSVHSLRLSKVRVCVSLEGVTFYSYSGFR